MPTTYIVDKDGNQIDASTATVPSDCHFSRVWSLSGSGHQRGHGEGQGDLQGQDP